MHILHIEESFIPNLGYQINLLTKYMALDGHKITILSTKLDKIVENQKVYLTEDIKTQEEELKKIFNIDVIRVPVKGLVSNRCYWDKSVFSLIQEINPDVIYLHGNDSLVAMQYFLFYLKKINIPVVTDSHMLEVASRNRFARFFRIFYRKFITPILVKNQIPVIRVVDDNFINVAYNIPYELSPLMSFGSDVDLFHPNDKVKKEFREENLIRADDFVVVYAGKLSEDKDALFFAQSIREKISSLNRKVVFVIIGNTHGEYGKNVEEIFAKSENKIIRFPLQKYNDLPKFFQMADVALIPSAASLTFYDMQAAGLPIIWSDIPVNEKRTINENGFLFSAKSSKDMRNQIIKCSNMDKSSFEVISKNARKYIVEQFSYKDVAGKYIRVLENEIIKRERYKKYR
ncbi:glycosyltransferase family 4 protein [Tepidibacillus marianensis]|uniref:glycosyltransferase family 4 protein n=1 Tax=Tepidibacillus marianensis TaxID=3131995 RepID=UPI0030CFD5A1